MAGKKMPPVIYVKCEEDGDDSYLVAGEKPGDIADSDGSVVAARYRLMDTGTVRVPEPSSSSTSRRSNRGDLPVRARMSGGFGVSRRARREGHPLRGGWQQ